jgi:mRNA-degrading endonuclease toxin of MazEF toxin-antitoxin module
MAIRRGEIYLVDLNPAQGLAEAILRRVEDAVRHCLGL